MTTEIKNDPYSDTPTEADKALALYQMLRELSDTAVEQFCGPAEEHAAAVQLIAAFREKAVAEAVKGRDNLAALVVRLMEALANNLRLAECQYSVPEVPGGDWNHVIGWSKKALALVPADLADSVVVKRSEWDRLKALDKAPEDIP